MKLSTTLSLFAVLATLPACDLKDRVTGLERIVVNQNTELTKLENVNCDLARTMDRLIVGMYKKGKIDLQLYNEYWDDRPPAWNSCDASINQHQGRGSIDCYAKNNQVLCVDNTRRNDNVIHLH